VNATLWRHPALLWSAFIAVHLWLIWLGFVVCPASLGDLSGVYKYWMEALFTGQYVVGISTIWVYPLLALVPMMVATVAGLSNFVLAWLIMVAILDVIVFSVLIHPRRAGAEQSTLSPRAWGAWWWTLALLALGPVALGRIDSVVTPIAILGLLFLLTRPMLAGVLLAVGAWMKVWPGAIIVAAIALIRRRLWVLLGALALSVAVVVVGLTLGAGANLWSFIGFQGTRGLQIESPAATPYLWMINLGNPESQIYFDQDLLTYQISGPNVGIVSSVMTWVMLGGVLVTLGAITWRSFNTREGIHYVPAASLALVMALILFNKVGSPQYLCWVIPPVLLGLLVDRARFVPLAVISLALIFLTQLIYPWMYDSLLSARVDALIIITLRNLLEVLVWVWALRLVLKR
jgi:hypothetical protein